MQDPAFLFYPNDYLGGTAGMSLLEKGAYMELLVMQFNKGAFTKDQAKKLLNGHFEEVWKVLCEKFTEVDGKFFNERLQLEKEKRKIAAQKNKDRIQKYWDDKKNTAGNTDVYTKPIPMKGTTYENENENTVLVDDVCINENQNENFIAPKIQKVFFENFPAYPKIKERDLPACLQIAYKISDELKLDRLSILTVNMGPVLHRWGEIVNFIASDNWFATRSLHDINNEWQRLIQKINNDGKTISSNSGKHGTGETSRIEALKKW